MDTDQTTGSTGTTTVLTGADAAAAFNRRDEPIGLLAADAPALAAACHAMARRFHRGGRLLAFGSGLSAADAAHVVVEFVHPVIIGKRALPALALPGASARFAAELALFGDQHDIALAIAADGGDDGLAAGLTAARERGMLTVALLGAAAGPAATMRGVDHVLTVGSADPRVVREGHVTIYHVLWELVHVFLDAPEVLE
jgi:D-sedoheptulose 7-phosphate isomerase